MPTEACKIVQEELMFLGDILCYGIVKKGLEKVGSIPDIATPADLTKALDIHIEAALVSFVGPSEARQRVIKIKSMMSKQGGDGAS
ncbi:MAG: hypothetical protein V1934_02905 [Methanobacteriota archaeon]